jgi:hypothetical protein
MNRFPPSGESGRLLINCVIMVLYRLNRDAAMKQVERMENNKKAKEKDRREAQEELEKAEFR